VRYKGNYAPEKKDCHLTAREEAHITQRTSEKCNRWFVDLAWRLAVGELNERKKRLRKNTQRGESSTLINRGHAKWTWGALRSVFFSSQIFFSNFGKRRGKGHLLALNKLTTEKNSSIHLLRKGLAEFLEAMMG